MLSTMGSGHAPGMLVKPKIGLTFSQAQSHCRLGWNWWPTKSWACFQRNSFQATSLQFHACAIELNSVQLIFWMLNATLHINPCHVAFAQCSGMLRFYSQGTVGLKGLFVQLRAVVILQWLPVREPPLPKSTPVPSVSCQLIFLSMIQFWAQFFQDLSPKGERQQCSCRFLFSLHLSSVLPLISYSFESLGWRWLYLLTTHFILFPAALDIPTPYTLLYLFLVISWPLTHSYLWSLSFPCTLL